MPNGSYVSNGTLTSRTFLCKSGSVFPDSKERKRTLECRNGKWNETATKLPSCVGKNSSGKFITLCHHSTYPFSVLYFIHFIYRHYYQLLSFSVTSASTNPSYLYLFMLDYRVVQTPIMRDG